MDAIQTIYIALFGRPADPLGLDYFMAETNNGADLSAIGDLANQAEYQDRFIGMSGAEIITSIYQSLFGRNPEQAGLEYFLNELNSGRQNINTIAINIAHGALGDDLATLNNKIVAANAFTAAIDTPDELAAYRGDAAADLGRAFLAGITADEASVPDADAVAAAVAGVVNRIDNTINLTTSVDSLVGTAGNDEFKATVDGANTTLNAGDSVDGGAGRDKVSVLALDASVDFSAVTVKNVESLEVDARLPGSAAWIDVTGTSFTNIDVNLNGKERTDDVVIDGVAASGATTIRDADFDTNDIELNYGAGALNAVVNLTDLVDVDDVDIYHGGEDGSALTVNVNNVNKVSGLGVNDKVETLNVNVVGDTEIDNIYVYSGYAAEDELTVNLSLSGDLLINWFDLPDNNDDGVTTLNATGAGNLTITELDDGLSTGILNINAASVAGNVDIRDIDANVGTVDLGAGDDYLEFAGSTSGATITTGAGADVVAWANTLANLTAVADEDELLNDIVTITDFNGSADTLIVDFASTVRYTVTNLDKTALNNIDNVFDAVDYIAGQVGLAEWAAFTWGGDTYIYGDDGVAGLSVGDALITLTGYTGAIDGTNFLVS